MKSQQMTAAVHAGAEGYTDTVSQASAEFGPKYYENNVRIREILSIANRDKECSLSQQIKYKI